ncbi:hypothetical protein J2857_003571 [Neorhizobium galegae]|uniref:hypothetical protein n=1 Tax=Neorhizobium galegae TaxID=399 RepID=UPI001AE7F387|nr:hypothetical protein [Neorhizobium galegae]MBP2560802.1 hypothetical protein [Neorhizobium galegae]
MTIVKHESKMEITCNSCPVTYCRSYAEEDFSILLEDIKAEGWRIKREAAEWTHRCPDCSRWTERRLL